MIRGTRYSYHSWPAFDLPRYTRRERGVLHECSVATCTNDNAGPMSQTSAIVHATFRFVLSALAVGFLVEWRSTETLSVLAAGSLSRGEDIVATRRSSALEDRQAGGNDSVCGR